MEKEISKHVHINNGHFEIIPLIKENQVQKCFISGQSGSGKSTWISNYAQTYKKLFPNNSIYVISRHNEDPVLDKIKGIKRLELDEEILEAEIDIEDFKDSLIILDDIETISDKKINKLITNLRDDLLQNCRHHNIYLCCVSHSILNYGYTRSLILESDLIVFFPRSGGYQIKRYLKEYQGYNKEQINIIMRLPSRWVCINKNTYPPSVISENDIYIL
jgi:hypothetical protein